jgi:TolB protein
MKQREMSKTNVRDCHVMGRAALLSLALVAGSVTAAYAGRSDTAHPIAIEGIAGSAQNPCLSPDGARLAFTNFETRYNVGNAVVREVAISGGRPLLTLSPTQNQSVNLPGQCWSAPLGLVAYSSDVPGRDEI